MKLRGGKLVAELHRLNAPIVGGRPLEGYSYIRRLKSRRGTTRSQHSKQYIVNTVVNTVFKGNSQRVTSKGQPPLSSGNIVSGQYSALRRSLAYLEGPDGDDDEAKAPAVTAGININTAHAPGLFLL